MKEKVQANFLQIQFGAPFGQKCAHKSFKNASSLAHQAPNIKQQKQNPCASD
jgi:hypothetical protein